MVYGTDSRCDFFYIPCNLPVRAKKTILLCATNPQHHHHTVFEYLSAAVHLGVLRSTRPPRDGQKRGGNSGPNQKDNHFKICVPL